MLQTARRALGSPKTQSYAFREPYSRTSTMSHTGSEAAKSTLALVCSHWPLCLQGLHEAGVSEPRSVVRVSIRIPPKIELLQHYASEVTEKGDLGHRQDQKRRSMQRCLAQIHVPEFRRKATRRRARDGHKSKFPRALQHAQGTMSWAPFNLKKSLGARRSTLR